MYVHNHSNLSGFQTSLFSSLVYSVDKPSEQFLISGQKLPVNSLPILQGAKFLERLWRGSVPFMIVGVVDFSSVYSQKMYRGIYLPHVDYWEEIFESQDIRFFLSNMLALDVLSINLFIDCVEASQVMEWYNNHNFYLFVCGVENENQESESLF